MMYGVAGLLIAAAAGYWVMTLADSQKGNLKKFGQYLGLAIVVVSVLGTACKIYCLSAGQVCPMSGKAMMMPRGR